MCTQNRFYHFFERKKRLPCRLYSPGHKLTKTGPEFFLCVSKYSRELAIYFHRCKVNAWVEGQMQFGRLEKKCFCLLQAGKKIIISVCATFCLFYRRFLLFLALILTVHFTPLTKFGSLFFWVGSQKKPQLLLLRCSRAWHFGAFFFFSPPL